MFLQRINCILKSEWLIPIVFLFAMFCKFFDLITFSITVLVVLICLILIFCDDVKNIIAIILYAPFYIHNIVSNNNETLFTLAVVTAVFALMIFTIVKLVLLSKKKAFKKGGLYIPLIFATVAFLAGGSLYNFNLETTLSVLMFCSATFFFYFISLNCTQNLGRFMCKVFVFGAFMVVIEMLVENVTYAKDIFAIFDRSQTNWVGAENINVAALFILLGVAGSFALGYKTKFDGIFFLIAVVLSSAVLITYCRVAIALTAVTLVLLSILSFVKSKNKINYAICFVVFLVIFNVALLMLWDMVSEVLSTLSGKIGWSGRDVLWQWCIDRFIEHPVLGIGFKYHKDVPFMGSGAGRYVLAHNTPIQWLCSLGLVGTSLMIVFTVFKYIIVFRKFFSEGVIIRLIIILIALSGLLDQAATMDPFIYNIVIVLLASVELINGKTAQDKRQVLYEKD